MFGQLFCHKRENVTLYSLGGFMKILKRHYGNDKEIGFDSRGRGITVGNHFRTWTQVAGEIETFDDAEIVTDMNENEKVMTWLNVL